MREVPLRSCEQKYIINVLIHIDFATDSTHRFYDTLDASILRYTPTMDFMTYSTHRFCDTLDIWILWHIRHIDFATLSTYGFYDSRRIEHLKRYSSFFFLLNDVFTREGKISSLIHLAQLNFVQISWILLQIFWLSLLCSSLQSYTHSNLGYGVTYTVTMVTTRTFCTVLQYITLGVFFPTIKDTFGTTVPPALGGHIFT